MPPIDNMEKYTIAIVEDNLDLNSQLRDLMHDSGEVEVLFTAYNGRDALDKIAGSHELPEVILMDIEMPGMNGVEATEIITRETGIKVLILTVFDDSEKIFEAIKAGAAGYLLKDSKPQRILQAIEDVLMGGAPMSPQIATKTLQILRGSQNAGTATEIQPGDYNLSEREIELLEHLVHGMSYKSIGEKMFISTGTVRKHVGNIYNKLHIHSKTEAANKAHYYNWFPNNKTAGF